jgi:hypothetical protein
VGSATRYRPRTRPRPRSGHRLVPSLPGAGSVSCAPAIPAIGAAAQRLRGGWPGAAPGETAAQTIGTGSGCFGDASAGHGSARPKACRSMSSVGRRSWRQAVTPAGGPNGRRSQRGESRCAITTLGDSPLRERHCSAMGSANRPMRCSVKPDVADPPRESQCAATHSMPRGSAYARLLHWGLGRIGAGPALS